jgi:Flp pilus assembly protein TadD
MIRTYALAGTLAAMLLVISAHATRADEAMLQDGATVPAVPTLQSVIGGTETPFDLKQASSGTTLVLYFFPKAFTSD